MFSAVSSAFIIDIYKQLQPDPSDQSVALLRAILLTLNHSTIPNETPTVPTVQENPPTGIVIVNCLLYASLLLSLLAAFAAMLGKQWLNRYLRHAGGSTIDRCGDRQHKLDGLQQWPFHFIIETLPVMLQIALLLLACGLCRYVMTINTSVACTLITLTGFGVLFYIVVVIAGASSYDCPFQTPGSALLSSSWKKFGPHLTPVILPVWRLVSVAQLSLVNVHHHLLTLLERIQLGILHFGFFLPPIRLNIHFHLQNLPLPTTQEGLHQSNPYETTPWFAPNELAIIQKKNTDNVRCVSWVLKDITDPETLDAAIILAGTIQWFEGGIDVKPLYDLIVSTFHTCFGSDRMLHQGLRSRAYYSGQAILWIHALAVCKSEDIMHRFPLPTGNYTCSSSDNDLWELLHAIQPIRPDDLTHFLLYFGRDVTHPHSQWSLSVLLHLSWAIKTRSGFPLHSIKQRLSSVKSSTPVDVSFNFLLICCNLLGSPIGEDVLKIQDKSYGISFPCFPTCSYHHLIVIAWSRSSDTGAIDSASERTDGGRP